jgi:GDP-mannose 6-dehydrogenase
MNISIFGLGYVGAVTAACLANEGHTIVGVDVAQQKVDALNNGEPPIIEPGLPELLQRAVTEKRLLATTSVEEAILRTEASLICVGTPSTLSGALDLKFVNQVAAQIGEEVRKLDRKHVLIFRSTMLPGSTQRIVARLFPDLVSQGKLEVYYYPEFLREGTAVRDFQEPSLVAVGTGNGNGLRPELLELFGEEAAVTDWTSAEMLKYSCNVFHAVKITFANEIGRLGKQLGADSNLVMSLLCRDTKLNLSPYYMRPGNPFGGSCLPKDVRAINYRARQEGLRLPLIDNLITSNEKHLQNLLQIIEQTGQQEAVILGLSFKSNTDDLRESPMVEVAQNLLGRGYTVRIYDPQLNLAQLTGSNKRMIDVKMPHLACLLQSDLKSAIGTKGVVIAAQKCAEMSELQSLISENHSVIDVNGWFELKDLPCKYEGFCW